MQFSLTGNLCNGGDVFARAQALGSRYVPAYPGDALVPVPRPPPPRPFDWGITADLQILRLATMYVSACSAVMHLQSHVCLSPVTLNVRRTINSARSFLEVMRVEPVVWVLHSFHVWKGCARNNTLPPVKWVFSVKRIEAGASFVADMLGSLREVLPATSIEHAQLLGKWNAMRRAIVAENPTSSEGVVRVVERYFSGNAFSDEVALARAMNSRIQNDLYDRAAQGEILWTI
jgi:hypothetical protein